MAEEGSLSLAQVVQNIMEVLSDAVNQLILLVVALQEQNAAMPAHIPPATEAVAGAANTLTEVARGLANDEYEDYPDIQGEIIQACDADQTRQMIAATDLDKVGSHPEEFAQHVGDLAGKVQELSEHVKNKAIDEEAPLSKANLERTGAELHDHSEKLIEVANALLTDPKNASKRKQFEDEMRAIEKHMQAAETPMKEKLKEISQSNPEAAFHYMAAPAEAPVSSKDSASDVRGRAKQAKDLGHKLTEAGAKGDTRAVDQALRELKDVHSPLTSRARNAAESREPAHKNRVLDALRDLDDLLPQQESAARDYARNPRDSTKRAKVEEINSRIGNDLDAISAALAGESGGEGSAPESLRDSAVQVKEHAKKARILGNKLADAGARGDSRGVDQALKDIRDSHRPAATKARNATEKIRDPQSKQRALAALDELEKLLPQQEHAARDLARAPKDPAKKAQLDQLSRRIGDGFNDVANVLEDAANALSPEVAQLLADGNRAAQGIQEAALSPQPSEHAVAQAAKNYRDVHAKLTPKAVAAANSSPHPYAGHRTQTTLDNILNDLHPRQEELAGRVAQNPSHKPERAALKAATNNVGAALDAVRDIITGQPERRRDTSIDPEIDQLIDKEKEHAKKVELATSPQEVSRAAKDARDAHTKLTHKAAAAARKSPGRDVEPRVLRALDSLQNELLPRQEELAKKASQSRDPAVKQELKDASDDVEAVLDGIRDALAGAPDAVRDAALDARVQSAKAKDLGTKLVAASAKGDNKAVDQALKDLQETHRPLAAKTRNAAGKIHDPVQQHKVLRALDELDTIVPLQESYARELAQQPNDPVKKDQLEDVTNDIAHDLDELADLLADAATSHAASPAADPELSRLVKIVKGHARQVETAAAAGAPQEVAQATKDTSQAQAKLAPKAATAAKKAPNPSAAPHVARLLDTLNKEAIPKQEELAREVAKNPNDEKKKEALRDATNAIDDLLDEVVDAIGGKSSAHAVKDTAVGARAQAKKQKDLGDKLLAAGTKGDPKGVDQALKDINDGYRSLASRARKAADRVDDPKSQARLRGVLKDLDNHLPEQAQAARDLARNPKDSGKKAKLEDANRNIARDLAALADALTDAADAPQTGPDLDLDTLLRKAQDEAQGIEASVAKAAPSEEVSRGVKDVKDTYARLAPKAKVAARNSPHAFAEPRVAQALHELQYYLIPQQEELAQRAAQAPKDEAKKAQLKDATDKIYDELDEIRDALKGEGIAAPEAARDTASNTKAQSKKAKDLGRKLAEAGAKGDAKGVDQALKDLHNAHRDVASKARKAAAHSSNPDTKQRLLGAANHLSALSPQQQAAARELARTPNDPAKKAKLDDVNSLLARDLDTIADALAEVADAGGAPGHAYAEGNLPVDGDLHRLISKAKEQAGKVEDAAVKPQASVQEVARAVKDQKDTHAQITPKAMQSAKNLPNKSDVPHVQRLLDNLDRHLLPKQEELAKGVVQDQSSEPKKSELRDATDKIRDELDNLRESLRGSPSVPALKDAAEDVKSRVKKAKDAGNKLADASNKGDKRGVDQALQDIRDSHGPLRSKAKNLAAKAPPPQKQQILDALADLDSLLPQQETAARDLARTPRDPAKKTKLDGLNDQIGKDLDQLSGALAAAAAAAMADLGDIDPSGPASSPHIDPDLHHLINKAKEEARALEAAGLKPTASQPDIVKRAKDSQATLGQLAPKALAAASKAAHPHAEPHIRKTLDSLQKTLLPKQEEAAKNASRDPKKKDELKNVTKEIESALESIVDALSGTKAVPQAVKDVAGDAKVRAKKSHDLGNNLLDASTKGDLKAVDQALKDLRDTQGPLLSKSRAAVSQLPPHHKQRVLDALKDLDSLLPAQETSGRDLARNPRDPAKKAKLEDVNRRIGKGLDAISDSFADAAGASGARGSAPSSSSDAPDSARKKAQKQQGLARKLEAAASNNPEAVAQVLRDIQDQRAALGDEALAAVAGNAAKKHDVEGALAELDALLPAQASAARDAASAPRDRKKKQALEKIDKHIADTLDELAALLGDKPSNPDALDSLIQQERDKVRETAAAAKHQAPAEVDAAAKDASDVFKKLAPKAKAVSVSPAVRRVIDKSLADIGSLLPNHANYASQVAAGDSHQEEPLRKATKEIEDALDALAAALATDELQKEVAQAVGDLKKLSEALTAKRTEAVPTLLLHAVSALTEPPSKVLPLARRIAQLTNDPESKAHLLKAIDEASAAFPVTADSLRENLSGDPRDLFSGQASDFALADLEAAMKALERLAALGVAASPVSESVAAANRASDALEDLIDAAREGDRDGVEKAANQLNKLQPKLIRTSRSAADTISDPNRKKKLFGAIDELDDVLPAVIAAARDAANNPRDAKSLARLDEAGGKADNTLDNIADDSGLGSLALGEKVLEDLDNILAASANSDPEWLLDAAKDYTKHEPMFADAASEQAACLGDQSRKINDPINKLDNGLADLLRASHEVIKDPKAEAPKKKLANHVAEARSAVKAATDAIRTAPPLPKDAPQEVPLAVLLPELVAAAEAARDRPSDAAAQRRLAEVAEKIASPLEKVLSPGEQAAASAEEMTNGLNAIVQAANRGDQGYVNQATKDLAPKHDKFTTKTKQAAVKLKSPERKEQANGAVDDVAFVVPKLTAAAKQVAQNPKDQAARKQLLDLNRVADDGLTLARTAVKRPRNVKEADAPEKAARRLKITGAKGNTPDDDVAAIRKLKGTGRELDALVKDEPIDFLKGRKIAEAIADLEKRLSDKHGPSWGKDRSSASKAAANRNAPASQEKEYAGLADAKKSIEAAIDEVRRKKYTPLQSTIHQANDGIRKLRISTFRGDPQVANVTKLAIAKQGKVVELAKQFAAQAGDQTARKKAEEAIRELETLIPQQEAQAKAAIQNKNDPKNWDALDDSTIKAEAALATLTELVHPSEPSAIRALAKKSKAEVPKLLDAAKAGDAKAAEAALANINDINKRLADAAKGYVAKSADPELARDLEDGVRNLHEAAAQLSPALKEALANKANLDKLANSAKSLYDPLENVTAIVTKAEEAKAGEGERSEEAKTQARVVLAAVKKGGSKLNPTHLIKASQNLAGLMADLVGQTKVEAYAHKEKGGLTDRAKAALELDEMLSEMEATAKQTAKPKRGGVSNAGAIQSLESVLANLTAVASSAPEKLPPIGSSSSRSAAGHHGSSSGTSQFDSKTSGNLSDSINKVAKDIQARAGTDTDAVSVVSRDLAAELQRFAKADQERRRQDMLISGRAISSHILRLIAEIKVVAGQCRDAVLQDKLLKHAQTLRNFSIQLKILASVKAASSDDSSNNAQLASMTQSLGNVLTDVSTTITIMKKSKKV